MLFKLHTVFIPGHGSNVHPVVPVGIQEHFIGTQLDSNLPVDWSEGE